MSISFGRTIRAVLPTIAIASLGATIAYAAPVVRPGIGGAAIRPAGAHVQSRTHGRHAAAPGPIYFGGGATLPAIAYVGAAQATAGLSTSANPAIVPGIGTTGSVLGYFASNVSPNHGADQLEYCQTGSGFGKKVFDGADQSGGLNADLPCAPLGTTPVQGTNGFGAVSGSYQQGYADFAGSDAPLSTTEFGTYVANAQNPTSLIFGRGVPVQVPFIIGSVALLYNNPDISGRVNLTTKQVCQIAGGYITNWSQLGYPSRTLSFALRSDGSGTSFSFSNHLNKACGNFVKPNNFGVSQNYDEYLQASNPCPASDPTFKTGVMPCPLNIGESTANFLPASGNPGVVAAIENAPGAIGYVEAANAAGAVNGTNINFATVNGKDPIRDLPAAAKVVTGALKKSMAIGSDVPNGRAPLVALSPADSCVLIVPPLTYAAPANGYSIIAVSNLEFSSEGNAGDAADLRAFATTLITKVPENVGPGKITSVDLYGKSNVGTTGYSTLNQKQYQKAIKLTAASCIGA